MLFIMAVDVGGSGLLTMLSVLNDRMIDELERIWKEVVMA
jgi:hypothetical protein